MVIRETLMSQERRDRSRKLTYAEWGLKDIIVLLAVLAFGLSTRVLIAPYTGHGYDINVHRTWLFSLLENGLFFYVAPEGMELFGKSWAHDPNFCELPPIYPSALFLAGKIYALLRPNLEDIYLLVLLMKLPQIIAECGIAVLVYYIVRKETDLRLGAFAAIAFLINPITFFLTAVWGAPESLVAILVIASVYAAYKSMNFLAALLLGVSLIVKPYSIVVLIPLLLFSYADLKFFKTLALPLVTAVSAVITASPWLIAQRSVFIRAMWAGAVHNIGIRMWEGTIWAFPSFWRLIKGICDISGFPYAVVAPFQFYIYLLLTFVLCYFVIRSRVNLEKRNTWFITYLFMFSFMMFMPSAHEKWVYACFPLIVVAAFLRREDRTISLLMYAGLTFTLFEAIYGDCRYFFVSTDVLPMPRNFMYGGVFAEAWYYILWSAAGAVGRQFS
ncbi:MAG: hypothetical protein ACE5NN_04605, partial [Candidatus Bathyarchaeia archaeon]